MGRTTHIDMISRHRLELLEMHGARAGIFLDLEDQSRIICPMTFVLPCGPEFMVLL